MNKIILSFLILVIFYNQNSIAQYENVRIDREEIYQKNQNSPNSNPQLDYLSYAEYYYDNGGNKYTKREAFSRPTISDEFAMSVQIINTYNEDNNLLTSTNQIHDGNDYIDSFQSVYTYNTNGDIETQENFNYLGSWQKNSLNTYTYNPDLTLQKVNLQMYDIGTDTYYNSSLVTYDYENGLMSQINGFTYSGEMLVEDYYGTFSYNENDDPLVWEYFDHNGTDWEKWQRYTYNYSLFVDRQLESLVQENWDSNVSNWVNNSRTLYNYGEGEILSELIFQGYDESLVLNNPDEGWYNGSKIIYFTSTLNTDNIKIEKSLAYPNPFKNHLTISLSKSLSTDGQLFLYDSKGKEISNTELKSGTKTISLSNGHLATGIYFIKISNADYHQTIKIVKE